MKQRRVQAPSVTVPDFRVRDWNRVVSAVVAEAREHEPSDYGDVGDSDFGQRFRCSVCRHEWPCRFVRWAHALLNTDVDSSALRPLKLAIDPPTEVAPR